MSKFLIAFATVAAFGAFEATGAKAEVTYPWCAYYGTFGSQATNCGFTSYRQCLATVSGIGGYCERNPRYSRRAKPRR